MCSAENPSPAVHKIGITAKVSAPKCRETLSSLLDWLAGRNLEAVMDVETAACVGLKGEYQKSQVPSLVDLMLVLGGDGTLLSVARLVPDGRIPILGINLGGLGFLTEVTLEGLFPTLEKVFAGEYTLDERLMLNVHIHRQGERIAQYCVLNDVVINKSAVARIIDIDTFVDGRYVNTFRADGLIVATPTGSTAYSLAAGGPIVFPTLGALILAPICPHTLTNRPLVVPDTVKIELILMTENEDVVATMDGQVGFALRYQDRLEVRQGQHRIKLIRPHGADYFEVLRRKLKWGER